MPNLCTCRAALPAANDAQPCLAWLPGLELLLCHQPNLCCRPSPQEEETTAAPPALNSSCIPALSPPRPLPAPPARLWCRHAEAVAEARNMTLGGDAHAPEVLALRSHALYLCGNMPMAQQLYQQALRCGAAGWWRWCCRGSSSAVAAVKRRGGTWAAQ
jgi:hypothetical protein